MNKLHANTMAVYYGKKKELVHEIIKTDKEVFKKLGFDSFKLAETRQQFILYVKKAKYKDL